MINTQKNIIKWLDEKRNKITVGVKKVPFSELVHWIFTEEGDILSHSSKRFFSIQTINVKIIFDGTLEWNQLIKNQPGVMFLRIIAKKINVKLCFLMLAKIGSGTVNNVQISPILQSTRSNFTERYKDKAPTFIRILPFWKISITLD